MKENYEILVVRPGTLLQRLKLHTRGRGGEFRIVIQQLDGGQPTERPIEICGFAGSDGELTVSVAHGSTYFKKTTSRDGKKRFPGRK